MISAQVSTTSSGGRWSGAKFMATIFFILGSRMTRASAKRLQKMWIRCCEGTSVTTTSLSCSAERIKNFRTYARTGEKQDKKSIKTLFHKIIEKLPLNIFSPRSTPLVVVDVSDCANENNIELDRRERSPNWFIAVASAEYQLGEALPLHTTPKVRLQRFKSVFRWF